MPSHQHQMWMNVRSVDFHFRRTSAALHREQSPVRCTVLYWVLYPCIERAKAALLPARSLYYRIGAAIEIGNTACVVETDTLSTPILACAWVSVSANLSPYLFWYFPFSLSTPTRVYLISQRVKNSKNQCRWDEDEASAEAKEIPGWGDSRARREREHKHGLSLSPVR